MPGNRPQVSLSTAENLARITAAAQFIANAAEAIIRSSKAHLTLADWALLQLCAQAENPHMGQLAALSGVTRQRIQKQLDSLAQAKYVSLATSAEDKRLRTVSLTPAGREVLKKALAAWAGKINAAAAVQHLQSLDGERHRVDRIARVLCRVARDERIATFETRVGAKGSGKQ